MIRDSTVLVLDAGASIEYGFPSGVDLRQQIVRELRNGDAFDRESSARRDSKTLFALLYQLEKWPSPHETPQYMRSFAHALEDSGLASVDLFLERRSEFASVGNAAIAAALMRYEDPDLLHDRSTPPRWYEYLWNRLADVDAQQFGANQLSLVTFNYDRSLEQFLSTAMQDTYPSDVHRRWPSALPIYHIHGELGPLAQRQYKTDFDLSELKKARDSIRVVTEPDDSQVMGMMVHCLEQAYIICFLGFAYHESNMRKLNEGNALLSKPKTIYGTTMGIGQARRERLKEFFTSASRGHNVQFDDGWRDVMRYLEHFACLG